MTQPKRKPRLDLEQHRVLTYLASCTNETGGAYVKAVTIQRVADAWPIRPVLDNLKRRGLVDHDGARDLLERYWTITDAGREALQ